MCDYLKYEREFDANDFDLEHNRITMREYDEQFRAIVDEIRADERERILKLVRELKSRYESFKHEEYYVSAMVVDLEDLEEEINEFMDLH